MDAQHQIQVQPLSAISRPLARLFLPSAGVVAALLAALLCADGRYRDAAILAATVLGGALVIAANVSVESILVTWFVTTPVASFLIRVPLDRSIITYNRAVFAALIIILFLRKRREGKTAPASVKGEGLLSITKFEAAWGLLSLAALASAAGRAYSPAYAARMAIDAFWLPLLAFHIARTHFNLRRSARALVPGVIALALFLFASGLIEFATGSDLFRYKGSEILREGERRINGPFISDSSYAIICLLLFVFMLAAVRLLRVEMDRTARLAFGAALAGVAGGAVLPLFRSVAAALIICWIVLEVGARLDPRDPGALRRTVIKRGVRLTPMIAAIVIVVIAGAAVIAPSVFESRLSDPRTAFGRLATWRAAATIALTSPVLGLGLGNYSEYFREKHYYRDELIQDVFEARAADSPHSNFLWIAAELGLIAFGLYLAANIYLLAMGWRALRRSALPRERIAASCFLALLLAYWIPGLALASGEYSDLNLCFFFLLGALSGLFARPASA